VQEREPEIDFPVTAGNQGRSDSWCCQLPAHHSGDQHPANDTMKADLYHLLFLLSGEKVSGTNL
jgi:hypothetical protein